MCYILDNVVGLPIARDYYPDLPQPLSYNYVIKNLARLPSETHAK